jgi:hypothetical protein
MGATDEPSLEFLQLVARIVDARNKVAENNIPPDRSGFYVACVCRKDAETIRSGINRVKHQSVSTIGYITMAHEELVATIQDVAIITEKDAGAAEDDSVRERGTEGDMMGASEVVDENDRACEPGSEGDGRLNGQRFLTPSQVRARWHPAIASEIEKINNRLLRGEWWTTIVRPLADSVAELLRESGWTALVKECPVPHRERVLIEIDHVAKEMR